MSCRTWAPRVGVRPKGIEDRRGWGWSSPGRVNAAAGTEHSMRRGGGCSPAVGRTGGDQREAAAAREKSRAFERGRKTSAWR
jgi:hypothetical protein